MHSKVFDFAQRNALVLPCPSPASGCGVVLWIRAESANVDLAGGDGAVGVDNEGEPRVLVGLVGHLGVDVDTGEPAAVAGVGVVPADCVLFSLGLEREVVSGEIVDSAIEGHVERDKRIGGERAHSMMELNWKRNAPFWIPPGIRRCTHSPRYWR